MSRKTIWGFAALIILLIAAGGFIYWQWSTVQQMKEQAAQDDKLLEEENKPEVTAETPIDFTKPPPGKTFEGGGHWHNGEWHDAPHTTPASTEESSVEPHVHTWADLSLEERKQLVEIFYRERGLKPPPEGYEYRWTSSDAPMLDDNGEPILHPIGEPIVKVETGIGFAPTPAQYQRYKALQVQYSQHMQAGNITEAEQIAADIALLEKEAEGEIPIIRVLLKSSGLSDEQVKEKIRQAADSVRRSAYEAHNLEYLLD
ncbi:MAG: hypothetical protein OXI43_02385 [Candidatus Poribacteria bacterium]|nr:hypothetical protein [Candidatus Poribacteria bacterium]